MFLSFYRKLFLVTDMIFFDHGETYVTSPVCTWFKRGWYTFILAITETGEQVFPHMIHRALIQLHGTPP